MDISKHSFMEYRKTITANREIFLLKYPHVLLDFLKIDDYFSALSGAFSNRKLLNGNSLVSFIPFTALMQRQTRNAFEAFATAQSYQGWVLLRPALEAALIMGKWTDCKEHAAIWMNRDKDRKTYQREYTGKSLESKSLPRSQEIRAVLSRINDDFMHLNPSYYTRHSRFDDLDHCSLLYSVSYFDGDNEQDFHIHAFMHLCVVVLQSICLMLDACLQGGVGIVVDVEGLEKAYSVTVKSLCGKDPERTPVLTDLGLWRMDALERLMTEPNPPDYREPATGFSQPEGRLS